MTAKGTSEYWKDFWGLKFQGAGEYNLEDGTTVTITKAEKVPPPKDLEEDKKRHISVLKYGYGQMFHGVFSGPEPKQPPTPLIRFMDHLDEIVWTEELEQLVASSGDGGDLYLSPVTDSSSPEAQQMVLMEKEGKRRIVARVQMKAKL